MSHCVVLSYLLTYQHMQLQDMSANVGDESTESGVPENIDNAFGISILAIVELDI